MNNLSRLGRLATTVTAIPALLSVGRAARADLVFQLEPPIQGGSPGGPMVFSGALANPDPNEVFLNTLSINLDGSAQGTLEPDDAVFLSRVPLSLAPNGDQYTGPIFGFNVTPVAVPGAYFGSVTLVGGADGAATDTLGTQYFQVVVTPAAVPAAVPEPSPLGLLLVGLGGAALAARRRPGQQRVTGGWDTRPGGQSGRPEGTKD